MIGLLIALPILVVVIWRRTRARNTRAGLNADRPTFQVAPPGGRIRRSSKETL